MERYKWIPVLALILILSGCGGGAGAGNSGTPIPPVPPVPNNPPVQPPQQSLITRENAAEHIAASLKLIDDHTFYIYDVNYTVFSIFFNHAGEGSYFIEYTCPADVGVRTLEAQFSATGDSGEIVITNDKCGRGHYTTEYNGVIRITVERIAHPWYPYPTEYTVDFDNYEIYKEIENTRHVFNGTISAGPYDEERLLAASNLIITEEISGSRIQADELFVFTNIPDLGFPDVKFLEITGTAIYSDLGIVDLTTDTSTIDDLRITGSGNTNILFSFLDDIHFLAKLDEDGDTLPDSYLVGYESGLTGDHGDNDYPVGTINGTVTTDPNDPVYISLLDITDPDCDFLDYTVDIIESPPGSQPEWHIDDLLNLVITVDWPGDYALDLVVNDGNGGTLGKSIDISANYDRPAVELEQTSFQYTIGDLAEIDVSPSNMTHGPFTYSFSPALPGMTISEDGILRWQIPSFDSFFPEMNFDVLARVGNSKGEVEIPLSFRVADPAQKHPLVRSSIQKPKDEKNIHVGDFDNDGISEILLTNNHNLIYTVECRNGGFVVDWLYPYEVDNSNYGIRAVLPLDTDNDGYYEIYVQTELRITIINMRNNTIIASQDLSGYLESALRYINYGRGIAAADIDNDGYVELAALFGYSSGSTSIALVVSAADLRFLWQTPQLGSNGGLGIGNVDGDDALEIVLAGGYVFDGITHSIEWEYSEGFGNDVWVADIDGNGVERIIASQSSQDPPVVYDAALKAVSFIFPDEVYTSDIIYYSMAAVDLDGDSEKEILVGDGSGKVFAYDADSGNAVEIWAVKPQYGRVVSLSSGDVDRDGKTEVIWGSGFNLLVFDPVDQTVDFQKQEADSFGPYLGGDSFTDGKGDKRIAFGAVSRNSYLGNRLFFMDPETGNISVSPILGDNNTGYFDFCVADYDLDGTKEVLFASADRDGGYLASYDPNTFTEKRFVTGDSFTPRAIGCGDASGDGHTDIAALWDDAIHLYDPYNEALIWSSDILVGSNPLGGLEHWAAQMIIHDLDGNGVPEILYLHEYGLHVYTKNGSTYTKKSINFEERQTNPSVLLLDLDEDDKPEIFLPYLYSSSSESENLQVLNANLDVMESFSVNGSIVALAASGEKDKTLLFATSDSDGNRIGLFDLANNITLWKSPSLLGTVSKRSLHVVRDPETSKKQLILGTQDAMYTTQ